MSTTKRDELEELFQSKLGDFEMEVQSDLLSPVQSRLRFDYYVKGVIITIAGLSALVITSIFLYNTDSKHEQLKADRVLIDSLNLDRIQTKRLGEKNMVLETANFHFTPVKIKKAPVLSQVANTEPLPQSNNNLTQAIAEVANTEEHTDTEPENIEYGYTQATPVMGFEKLYSYIREEIHYPDTLKEEKIIGTVQVGFVIEKSGKVTNVSVKSGLHPLLDKEAIRVIKNMPNWMPAKVNGTLIQSKMTIPITFNLLKETIVWD